MFRRAGRIGLIMSLASATLLHIGAPAAQATDVTFSQVFTNGSVPSASILTAWQTFTSQLTGSYGSFTFSSSNGQSITVTDPGVQGLADALRTKTSTSDTAYSVVIGANTWRYTPGYYFEFGNTPTGTCGGSGIYILRPTFPNANWGGFGSGCSSPTQTMTLTFTVSAPMASTFSTSQTSPTNITSGGTLTYSLVMSQSVTGMAAVDFQFGGTSSCNTPTVTGSGTTYSVTLTNCSEGNLILQLKANSVTGTTATGPSAIASANTIIIDRTLPTISSVTAPANQTYVPGNAISFTVNTSETVTVTGTPRLSLTIGSTTRYANYASGSNSRALVFTYLAQTSASDIDTNGITLNSPLELNGGTIADLATNAMNVFTVSTTSLASVLVAQKPGAPTIDSISATSTQLSVNFTAGSSNGSTITNYEYSTNNGSSWIARSPIATTSPLVISGLLNGTSYSIRLRAINAAGSGDSSTAVSATPTAVVVTGGSNISMTYGGSASSSQFTASGGTGPYTFTLSTTPSGVSISNGVVTASSATPAGTYIPNVIATDSGSQSGFKQVTISVAKASTSISISLPNSATSAALGGAVTITAAVSRAGAVNFMLDGSTISGCGSAAAAATTATCSWTPGALGSVSLTATFTPTDSSNYETSTTTTLSITVVNGVSTVTLSLAGGTTTPPKGQSINIIAAVDQAGRITFMIDGKRIAGCNNKVANVGNVTCSWKPSIQKQSTITARLVPTNSVYNASTSSLSVRVIKRSGTR